MIFNNMLSLYDTSNYSTWFYLWRMQGGATQRGTPGYCVVHLINNNNIMPTDQKH